MLLRFFKKASSDTRFLTDYSAKQMFGIFFTSFLVASSKSDNVGPNTQGWITGYFRVGMEVLQIDTWDFYQGDALHFCISAAVLFIGPSGFPSKV